LFEGQVRVAIKVAKIVKCLTLIRQIDFRILLGQLAPESATPLQRPSDSSAVPIQGLVWNLSAENPLYMGEG